MSERVKELLNKARLAEARGDKLRAAGYYTDAAALLRNLAVKLRRQDLLRIAEIAESKAKSLGIGDSGGVSGERQLIYTSRHIIAERDISDVMMLKPKRKFSDIGGLNTVKEILAKNVVKPLKHRDLWPKYGIERLIRGILMYGPPGCGKSLFAEAAAGELDVPLLYLNAATVLSKWFGDSEKIIVKYFNTARKFAPSIIFIDEVEALLPANVDSDVMARVRSIFLQEMQGFAEDRNAMFIVMMATNKPWNVDPAAIRTGRIDYKIYIPPPDYEARKDIFRIHLDKAELVEGIDYDELASLTEPRDDKWYSSSDIEHIVNEAKLAALLRAIKGGQTLPLTMSDLREAIQRVPPSIHRQMLRRYEEWTHTLIN